MGHSISFKDCQNVWILESIGCSQLTGRPNISHGRQYPHIDNAIESRQLDCL